MKAKQKCMGYVLQKLYHTKSEIKKMHCKDYATKIFVEQFLQYFPYFFLPGFHRKILQWKSIGSENAMIRWFHNLRIMAK